MTNQFVDDNGKVLFEVGDLIELIDASKKKLKISVGIVQHIANDEDGDIVYDPGYKKTNLVTWGLCKALKNGKWSVRVIAKGQVESLSVFRAPDGTIYDSNGAQIGVVGQKFQLGQRVNVSRSEIDSLSGSGTVLGVTLGLDRKSIRYNVEMDDNLGFTHRIEQTHLERIIE